MKTTTIKRSMLLLIVLVLSLGLVSTAIAEEPGPNDLPAEPAPAEVIALPDLASPDYTPGVSPSSISATLNPGQWIVVGKTINTPVIAAKPDIYFLADTTGSMGGAIANVRANAAAVLASIAAEAYEPQFGAGNYKDFPYDAYAFQNNAVVDGQAPALAAINGWSAGGGWDGSEAQLYALDRIADGVPGWRDDSTKIVVWFGDMPGHDPVCAAISGLSYDVTESSVTTKLQSEGIRVIAISVTSGAGLDYNPYYSSHDYIHDCGTLGGSAGQATRIASATGGVHLAGVAPGAVSAAILEGLGNLPATVTPLVSSGCEGLDFGFPPTGSDTVESGEPAYFNEEISANGSETGWQSCTVDWLINGNSAGPAFQQSINILVNSPPTADPNGPYLFPLAAGPFDGTGSTDPDGDVLTYEWTFGDGGTGTDAMPYHDYTAAGIYEVCLTVTDPYGASDTACTSAVIYDPSAGFVTGGGWFNSPEGAFVNYTECGTSPAAASAEMMETVNPEKTAAAMSEAAPASVPIEYTTINGCNSFAEGEGLQGETDFWNISDSTTWEYYKFYGIAGVPVEIEAHRTTKAMDPAMLLCFGTANDTDGIGPYFNCGPEMTFVSWADDNNGIPHGVGGWFDDPKISVVLPYTGWYSLMVFDFIGEGPGPYVPYELHYSLPEVELPTGKANFGFVAKYKKGATAPDGNTEFQFHAGDLNFHSSSYEWLVVTGSNYARFKGEGTINGGLAPDGDLYRFMIWAGDDAPDTFRIKIWWEDAYDVEHVVYDNGFDQAIDGGNIVIHTGK